MKSFASVIVFSAVVVGLVAAQPFLETRTSCKSNEFWYGERSCCLEHGGPPNPPPPPRSRDCPKGNWYWHNRQGCCVPRHPDPPQPTCGGGYNWSKGSWCCEENPSPTTGGTPAHPSQAPPYGGGGYGGSQGGYGGSQGGYGGSQGGYGGSQGGYGGSQGGYGGGSYGGSQGGGRGGYKHKRSHTKRNDTLCPTGFSACPIDGAKPIGSSSDYDCIDPLEDLRACGGCPTTGEGQDCAKIAHSWNVACVSGGCEVYSCAPGYEVSFDGKTCIPI